jgi:hypothetical protein
MLKASFVVQSQTYLAILSAHCMCGCVCVCMCEREGHTHTHARTQWEGSVLSEQRSFKLPPAGHAAHSAARHLIARLTSEREKQDYHSERYG